MEQKYVLNKDVDINSVDIGKYSIYNKDSKKTYIIGEKEYFFIKNLDGEKNIEELAEISGFSVEQIHKLLQIMDNIGVLNGTRVKRRFNVFRISLGVFNPNTIIKTDSFWVQNLARFLLIFTLPLLMVGIVLSTSNVDFYNDLIRVVQTPIGLLVIPITVFVTFLHEMGHVIFAKYYGANVPEMGIVLYWFLPAAYVNLSCVSFINEKSGRIITYMGGIIVNIFLIDIALICRGIVRSDANYIFSWFIADSLIGIIFNLFVFLKYDGYLILKELVGVSYLREKSFGYLKTIIFPWNKKEMSVSININEDINSPDALTKSMYVIYALFSILYLPTFIITLIGGIFLSLG